MKKIIVLILFSLLTITMLNTSNMTYAKSFKEVIDPDDTDPDSYVTSRIIEDVTDPGGGGGSGDGYPDITVSLDSISMFLYDPVPYPECTAHDVVDGDIECVLTTNVDNQYTGTYSIYFKATNSQGLTKTTSVIDVTVHKTYTYPYTNSGVYLSTTDINDFVTYANGDNVVSDVVDSTYTSVIYSFVLNSENSDGPTSNVEISLNEIFNYTHLELYLYDSEGELILSSATAGTSNEDMLIEAHYGVYFVEVKNAGSQVAFFDLEISGIDSFEQVYIPSNMQYTISVDNIYVQQNLTSGGLKSTYYIPIILIQELLMMQYEAFIDDIDEASEIDAWALVRGFSYGGATVAIGLLSNPVGITMTIGGLLVTIPQIVESFENQYKGDLLDDVLKYSNRYAFVRVEIIENEYSGQHFYYQYAEFYDYTYIMSNKDVSNNTNQNYTTCKVFGIDFSYLFVKTVEEF